MERKTITHQQPWGEELYEFENVPALVCRRCGEVFLEAEVGLVIDCVIQQHPEPKKYHQVPVPPWLNSRRAADKGLRPNPHFPINLGVIALYSQLWPSAISAPSKLKASTSFARSPASFKSP